jgi:hypothetical protein
MNVKKYLIALLIKLLNRKDFYRKKNLNKKCSWQCARKNIFFDTCANGEEFFDGIHG